MKLDRVDAYLVRFPLKKPYTLADTAIDHFDSVFVRMQSGGLSGWGEVFPGNEPILTSAWSTAVFACLKDSLLPRLGTNSSIDSATSLQERLQTIKGNRHAKAALDLAWWDLDAKMKKRPLHETLGGVAGKDIEIGLTFDRFKSPDEFLDDVKRAVNDGFRRLTLKIRPGWDLQVLGAVRNEHPAQMIQCDVEGSLDLDKHSDILYRFDDFMPALLEQPLSASEYVGHAMLQDSLRTTIGLDESITTLHQAEIALDLRSAGTFCVKPGKVGGLTEAKAIHDAAKAGDIDCYAGSDILTSIGYRFVVALASLPGFKLPTDYLRFDEYLAEDPGQPLKPVLKTETPKEIPPNDHEQVEVHPDEHGNMVAEKVVPYSGPNVLDDNRRLVLELWNEPGIGFDPNLELIERFALQQYSIS